MFQVVGCRGSTEITPRSLMATEGQILGVNLGHFTEVCFLIVNIDLIG